MTNKEIGELRRRMKPDRTNLTAVYGCYVASSGEVLSTFREPFGLMTEEDREKYLAIFRRALSGTPDKNLLDLSFTTKQVADSDEHRLLMRLRETALDDEEARQKLFQTIIGAVSFEENFLILLAHERYDVPFKAKDGAKLDDGSEVFSYFVCAVCPVKPGRELLSYIAEEKTFHNRSAGWAAGMPEAGFRFFAGENEFHSCMAKQIVGQPELGFLFPAFDGRRTNLYNCLFYTHSSGADNQPLIDALFHVQPPMPADEQRDTFSGVLRNALDDECSLAVVQQVRQEIKDRIDAWQEAKSDDPLVVSGDELKDVLESCGVSEDKRMQFGAQFDESFGGGAVLNPRNLIDVKKCVVKTPDVSITVNPERPDLIETRTLGGVRYILIKADEGVELNGIDLAEEAE